MHILTSVSIELIPVKDELPELTLQPNAAMPWPHSRLCYVGFHGDLRLRVATLVKTDAGLEWLCPNKDPIKGVTHFAQVKDLERGS